MKTHDEHDIRIFISEKNKKNEKDPAKTDCFRIHVMIV